MMSYSEHSLAKVNQVELLDYIGGHWLGARGRDTNEKLTKPNRKALQCAPLHTEDSIFNSVNLTL